MCKCLKTFFRYAPQGKRVSIWPLEGPLIIPRDKLPKPCKEIWMVGNKVGIVGLRRFIENNTLRGGWDLRRWRTETGRKIKVVSLGPAALPIYSWTRTRISVRRRASILEFGLVVAGPMEHPRLEIFWIYQLEFASPHLRYKVNFWIALFGIASSTTSWRKAV